MSGERPARVSLVSPSGAMIVKTVFSSFPLRPLNTDVRNSASASFSYVAMRTHTNAREASTTDASDRKLLSMFCLPGHQMPEMPWHCGAAARSRIGLPVRFASAFAPSHVPNHWISVRSAAF